MSVRCVLFDLFGTLVQYDASRINQAYPNTYRFIRQLGIPLDYAAFLIETDRVFAELDTWSLNHEQEFSMHEFAYRFLLGLGVDADERALDQFSDLYTTEWAAGVTPVKGVQAFLSSCSKKFRTGLITNTHHEPMVMQLLEAKALKPFEIVTTSVAHGRPKPHADIFLDTLASLDIAPVEAVYVGDTYRADFLGATEAGLTCYLIGQHARVPKEFQLPTVLDLPMHLLR
ncbi:MAG: putative hydrolase of the HAD superfamily [Candidatus Azotimanducaceae bacterium]|jgi:putative hydrolase of the HAD superfamily